MLACNETAALLRGWDDILIICHENPDGDALGSLFGLVRGLRSMGKRADWYCASPVPEKFAYSPIWPKGWRTPASPLPMCSPWM